MYTVTFDRRDFAGPRLAPGLRVEVQALRWRAVGGPWSARLLVRAESAERLWQAAELLRCGVTVFDELGAAWWGYVRAVEVVQGPRRARLDLAQLVNDVMVRYQTLSPDPWGGPEAWTAAAVDAASRAEYGRKAGVYAMGPATAAQADAYRAAMLRRDSLPRMVAGTSGAAALSVSNGVMVSGSATAEDLSVTKEAYAVLDCRGWWESLDWLFYKDGRGMEGHTRGGSTLVHRGSYEYAQGFPVGAESWKATEIWLKLGKVASPTDQARVVLYTGTAAAPSPLGTPGAIVGVATRAGVELAAEREWVRFVLPSAVALTAGATYWLLLERTTYDTVNYYTLSLDESASYAGGKLMYWNSTAWVDWAPVGDLAFMVIGTAEQGSILLRMLGPSGAGCGQFLTTLKLDASFGFDGRPYRDGKSRGREEIEALLKQGTLDGTRVLAQVAPDRSVRLYPQPASGSAELTVDQRGALRWRSGRRLHVSELAAGRWAALADLALQGGMLNGANGEVFVEACAWDAERGLRMEERD